MSKPLCCCEIAGAWITKPRRTAWLIQCKEDLKAGITWLVSDVHGTVAATNRVNRWPLTAYTPPRLSFARGEGHSCSPRVSGKDFVIHDRQSSVLQPLRAYAQWLVHISKEEEVVVVVESVIVIVQRICREAMASISCCTHKVFNLYVAFPAMNEAEDPQSC